MGPSILPIRRSPQLTSCKLRQERCRTVSTSPVWSGRAISGSWWYWSRIRRRHVREEANLSLR